MRYSYLTTQAEAEALVAKKQAAGWQAYWLANSAGCFEVRSWK